MIELFKSLCRIAAPARPIASSPATRLRAGRHFEWLAAILVVTLLTACGGSSNGDDDGKGNGGERSVRVPQWLVFTADKHIDGRTELFSVLDDGAIEPIRLSPPAMQVASFSLSADGREVAFSAQSDSNTDGVIDFNDAPGQLYRAPVDGSRTAVNVSGVLPAHATIREFDWSPTSGDLVFRADIDTDDVDETYLVEAASSTPVKINGPVGSELETGDSLWSPDGRYIAQVVRNRSNRFISDRVAIDVYDTAAGGPNSTRVSGAALDGSTFSGGGAAGQNISAGITWASDSSRLAYMLDDRDNNTRRYYQAFPDGAHEDVTGPLATDENGSLGFLWSDDARYLAYEVALSGVGVIALELFDTSDDSHRRILEITGGGRVRLPFAWQPAGDSIAFTANLADDGPVELFTVVVGDDGSSEPPPLSAPLPSDNFVGEFIWSPDGAQLAYLQVDSADFSSDLFTVAPAEVAYPVSHDAPPSGSDESEFDWLPASDRLLYSLGDAWYVTEAGLPAAFVKVSGELNTRVDPFENGFARELARPAPGSEALEDQRIAFLAEPMGEMRSALFAADIGGQLQQELSGVMTAGGNVFDFRYGALAGEVRALFSENDAPDSVRLANGSTASGISLVSGDDRGITVDALDGELDVVAVDYDFLDGGESVVVVYRYEVGNGTATVEQSATVTIVGIDDPPFALNAEVSVLEGSFVDIDLHPLVNDPEGESLTPSLDGSAAPANGSVQIIDNDTLRYTPSVAGPQSDSFGYRVSDGGQDSNEGTITVTIDEINDPPVVSDPIEVTVSELDPIAAIDLLFNSSDPEGDPLVAQNLSLLTGDGTPFTLVNDRQLTFDPGYYSALDAGESAIVIFDYQVSDGVLSTFQTVTVTINGA